MEVCPTTGKECAALTVLNSSDNHFNISGVDPDSFTIQVAERELGLVRTSQKMCDDSAGRCGVQLVGAVLAIKHEAVDGAKFRMLNPGQE
jgi:hypothetical protein